MEHLAPWHRGSSQDAPLVLIVLLNWNSAQDTATAVASLGNMDYPNFRTLIVDNGSSDDSVIHLEKLVGPGIELVKSPVNTGYTGGCNLGMEHALKVGADYIWLLNNDAVTEPGTLSSLITVAESDSSIGLVTPLIASLQENHLTFAGGVVSIEDGIYEDTNDPKQLARWTSENPRLGIALFGTALLVRSNLVRRIGMLDQRFFAYFEDLDYSVRSLQAGFRNVVDENSIVRHFDKAYNTTPQTISPHYWYYMARNESRFWRKHLGLLESRKMTWHSFNRFLRFMNRLESRPDSQQALLAGLWDGWLDRGGPYRPGVHMPSLPAVLVRLYSRRKSLQPKQRVSVNKEAVTDS